MPYPWNEDDVLVAADLNAAIAGVTANAGRVGPQGPPGALIQSGYGPPTEDAPDGTTYFDLSNGDVWTFGEPGGGGGVPDWVPADAVIHIDLVGGTPQGRAWSNGAEVAVDTLLGNDPNTVNGWDVSGYDPANLSESGYSEDDTTPIPLGFIGDLRSKALAGCTMRLQFKNGIDVARMQWALLSADGNHAVEADLQVNLTISSWDGPLNLFAASAGDYTPDATNVMAVTTTPNRLEAAANGGNLLYGTLTSEEYPVSGDGAIVAGLLSVGGGFVQSITIYDPLPTTAGLIELSEVM